MAKIKQPYLFSWEQVEASSDMDRLRLVLKVIPDEGLVRKLEEKRGKGRNDYPIRAMWNAYIAGIVFGHRTQADLLRELRRNAELRYVCGFDPFLGSKAVPSESAFSRFIKRLCEHIDEVEEIFWELQKKLGEHLPDLGERLAIDSKALRSYGRRVKDPKKRQKRDGRRDIDADVGVKRYIERRADGRVVERKKKWFGYKLHLIVDSKYELPLSYEVTKASVSDTSQMKVLMEKLEKKNPKLVERSKVMTGDRGYDSRENIELLYKRYGIAPVIDKRKMWKEKEETRVLKEEKVDQFVYDEGGVVYCICPETGERREMVYYGYERGRGALKYRCPAAVYGIECKGREECERQAERGVGRYGRVVRVPLSKDPRIFTPIPRGSRKWEREYKRRSAVERVNARIDTLLGFERHTIRGQEKMKLRMGVSLVVMLSMALGRIEINDKEGMRSLVKPVKLKRAA